jgi:Spy/CpxP family protein refolding chaperone
MRTALLFLVWAGIVWGQGPPPPGGDWDHDDRGGPPQHHHGPPGGPPGRWWHDPALIRTLNLTPDQQSRIDDLYQQNRTRLSDLIGALRKEESVLEPLLDADHPDQAQAFAQIDRVAQARADLEKANARMLLSFRAVLTRDQWKRLQSEDARPPGEGRR